MSLIRWSPFFDQFEEMERSLISEPSGRGITGFVPAVDVYETKDTVMVESPLAGVEPQDVEISVENNILTIKGRSESKSEVEEKDYYRKEVRTGSFYRQVALPALADADRAEASFEKGMLKVMIPKKPDTGGRAIKVNVKK